MMVDNIIEYYSQFSGVVRDAMSMEKKSIIKQVKDQIKIASWKDTSVMALRQAAKKTHTSLHKCVKHYRRILETPLSTAVGKIDASITLASVSSKPDASGIKFDVELLNNITKDVCNIDLVSVTDDLCVHIIDSAHGLRDATPNILTDENKGQVSNLKSMKRKALADYLKLFSAMGLASAASSRHQLLSDKVYLLEQPRSWLVNMTSSTDGAALINKPKWAMMVSKWNDASEYYYKILARLAGLQAAAEAQDVAGDIKRCTTTLDSLFENIISIRRLVCKFEFGLSPILNVAAKMQQATQGTSIEHLVHFAEMARVHDMALHSMNFMLQITRFLRDECISERYSGISNDCSAAAEITERVNTEFASINGRLAVFSVSESIDRNDPNAYVSRTYTSESEAKVIELQREFEDLMAAISSKCLYFGFLANHVNSTLSAIRQVKLSDREMLENTDSGGSAERLVGQLETSINECITAAFGALSSTRSDDSIDAFGCTFPTGYFNTTLTGFTSISTHLRFESISAIVNDLFLACIKQKTLVHLVDAHRLLERYILAVQYLLSLLVGHARSTTKLCHVLTVICLNLKKHGFCAPAQDESTQDGEGGESGQSLDGTGMASGTGARDVSDQIDNEEQVLGLDGDQDDDNEDEDIEESKNGLEMENEFSGTLGDVAQSSEEENDDKEEDEEADPDEEMGEGLHPDEVDEKVHGKESDEPAKESEDKVDDDTQGADDAGKTDIVAGDYDDRQENNDDDRDHQDLDYQDQQDDEMEAQSDPEGQVEETNQQAPDFNEDISKVDALDLPDDLDLEGSELDDDAGDVSDMEMEPEDEDGDGGDGEEKDGKEEQVEGEEGQEVEEGISETDEQAEQGQEVEAGLESDEDSGDKGDDDAAENQEENQDNPVVQSTKDDKKRKVDDKDSHENEFGKSNQRENASKGKQDENAESDQEMDNDDKSPKQSGRASNQNDAEQTDADDDQSIDPNADDDAPRKPSTSQKAKSDKKQEQQDALNPYESVVAAVEEWRRKLENVQTRDEPQEVPEDAESKQDKPEEQAVAAEDEPIPVNNQNQDAQFEFVDSDDANYDEEMVGVAPDDAELPNGPIGSLEDDSKMQDVADDNDAPMPDNEEAPTVHDYAHDVIMEESEGVEKNDGRGDEKKSVFTGRPDDDDDNKEHDVSGQDRKMSEQNNAVEPRLDEEELEQLRQSVEVQLAEWLENKQENSQAMRKVWSKFEVFTRDLATNLCESLRLILEPTKANKLKGDYRTGKRLNMRKIIPYIASGYKKDKIWMRRTKLSKRQYFIMISVDDSRSMVDSKAIRMAYETVALVARSLTLLEAGSLAVVSFGDRVTLLHPFEQEFTDESGEQVFGRFTFNQTRTNVHTLMHTSLGLFESAKANLGASGNGEEYSLHFVISDGICESHDAIRAMVREAADRRIIVVFVVLDNVGSNNAAQKKQHSSISDLAQVSYKQINGKMVMEMHRYLDTFPFDYFVVLRNITELPDVLSDALRQFFSLLPN